MYHVISCIIVMYCAVLHALHCIVLYYFFCIVPYQYHIVSYHISIIMYIDQIMFSRRCGIVLRGIVLYCIVLYCIILYNYCIVLYCLSWFCAASYLALTLFTLIIECWDKNMLYLLGFYRTKTFLIKINLLVNVEVL